jgi:hypothetical protein
MPRAQATSNPAQRTLRAYAFDPSRGARLENHLSIRVPYEKLAKGPVGRKIAVIDYDASNRCYYEGVDLDAPAILGQGGLAPSESNPQFHQPNRLWFAFRDPAPGAKSSSLSSSNFGSKAVFYW